MRSAPVRITALCVCILSLSLVVPPNFIATANSSWENRTEIGAFVRRLGLSNQAVCTEADPPQAAKIRLRDAGAPLAVLPHETHPASLNILLRATTQLQSFPLAREAFMRAATQWEAVIQTPITVVVDADFGSALFGASFDQGVVSQSDSQVIGGNSLYSALRQSLLDAADTSDKASVYRSLPTDLLPTDRGQFSGVTATAACLRALNILNTIADPSADQGDLGAPPAIGFNSSFAYDFDSSDGIDKDKLDFEAMVVHDLGHILGFVSSAGQPDDPTSMQPSILDLFRFRPDVTRSTFTGSSRVLSAGGDQKLLLGDDSFGLSSGKPDGSGGDGRSPSHWRDDSVAGERLGIMDPTLQSGEHSLIGQNDLEAFSAIGYRIRTLLLVPLTSGQPQIGGMPGPTQGLGFISHTQYSINVPASATALKIDLNGNTDVDLFARFGQRVFIRGFRPESDYFSATDTGNETITITAASSPPLKPGTYYIAVANFGPGDADFTVTATVIGATNSHSPVIFDLTPHLDGDTLQLECRALDQDADVTGADASFVDEQGRVVGASSVALNLSSRRFETFVPFTGLATFTSAVKAKVSLIDRAGGRSAEVLVDFGQAERGGLDLKSASFDGSRLTLKASGAADELRIEINGQVVAPPLKVKAKGSGTKLIVTGDVSQLALKPGVNRIRVKNSSGWSNILLMSR